MKNAIYKSFIYLFLAFNLVLIGMLWWHGSGSLFMFDGTGRMIALGRLTGLLAEACIALQLVLIGRISWIEQVFGHDRMNKLHRIIGYSTAAVLVLHPVLLTIGYARQNETGLVQQFLNFLNNWEDVFKALIGVVLILGTIVISLAIIRKRLRYETWHFAHLIVYVAVLLALGHQTNFGDFMDENPQVAYWYVLNYGALGLLILYRFLRPLYNFWRYRFAVEKVTPENADTASVYITGRNMPKFKFQAGQFANLTFLQKGMWFTHPFSFSAAPGNSVRFTIKASGDFTNTVRDLKPGTRVIIDGPLGRFTEASSRGDKYLFLAGGIGITPIRALMESLSAEHKDIVLLYAAKTPDDIVFRQELEQLQHRYHFVMSQISEASAGGAFETGRIDEEKVRRLVPDFSQREAYICGPEPMINAMQRLMLSLGTDKSRIHFEKFEY